MGERKKGVSIQKGKVLTPKPAFPTHITKSLKLVNIFLLMQIWSWVIINNLMWYYLKLHTNRTAKRKID